MWLGPLNESHQMSLLDDSSISCTTPQYGSTTSGTRRIQVSTQQGYRRMRELTKTKSIVVPASRSEAGRLPFKKSGNVRTASLAGPRYIVMRHTGVVAVGGRR